MDKLVIFSVVIPFTVFVVCVTTSALLAVRKNVQLHEHAPDLLTYGWGYYMGYSGIMGTVVVSLASVAMISADFYPQWFLIVLVYAVVLGIASYGVLKRHKWGWALQIPLSLNPGLWAFNSIYAHNRWREF